MDLFGGFAPAPSPAAPTAIDLGFGAPTPAPAAGATVKTISTLECAPPGGHYSQAVVVPPGASMVYVSGMLPITVTGEKKTGSMQEQTAQCLQNVEGALRGAGVMSKRGIVKVTAYITNVDKWDEFNDAYATWAGDAKPARVVVPVPALHHGFMVEIEAVAAVV